MWVSAPQILQRCGNVFWNQRARTEEADQAPKTDPRDHPPWFLAQPLWHLCGMPLPWFPRFHLNSQKDDCFNFVEWIEHEKRILFAVQITIELVDILGITLETSCVRLRRLQISEKGRLCSGFAYGWRWEQHMWPDNLFQDCCRLTGSLSGWSFLKFAVSVTHYFFILEGQDFRASVPQHEPSEGCFHDPRLLASRQPVCPNSFQGFLCLHTHTQASFDTMQYKGRGSASGIDRKLSIIILEQLPLLLLNRQGQWPRKGRWIQRPGWV